MPQISVIVPVYKVEPYLARCVDSILGQTFTDFELILVDDGSPDNCPALCDTYAAQDSRVHVIHQQNGGLSAARNAGIDWIFTNSDSQWITFVDSDDWIHSEMLQRLLDVVISGNFCVSICNFIETTEYTSDTTFPNCNNNFELWAPENYFITHNVNSVVACGKLYKKSCFQNIRYPVGKLHEDAFTTYKILFSSQHIGVLPLSMYYYYQNPSSITHRTYSFSHLASYDSYEEQIHYFKKNHFPLAERFTVNCYLSGVSYRLNELSAEKDTYLKIIKNLKHRKYFRFPRYARILDPSVESEGWTLTQAFPKLMWVYWHIQALKKKFKHHR